MKIKSVPESYSKLLIDYIPIAKELYFPLSNTNFSEININILIKIVDNEKKWLETFEAQVIIVGPCIMPSANKIL